MEQQKYEAMKARLTVNPAALTEELVDLPSLQQDAAEMAAAAQRERDNSKDGLEIAKAEAAAALRAMSAEGPGKPKSEKQIESEIMLNVSVRTAMDTLHTTDYELALWKTLADGFRTKTTSIRALADLIQAGYTSPQTIYMQRRGEAVRRRRELHEPSAATNGS